MIAVLALVFAVLAVMLLALVLNCLIACGYDCSPWCVLCTLFGSDRTR